MKRTYLLLLMIAVTIVSCKKSDNREPIKEPEEPVIDDPDNPDNGGQPNPETVTLPQTIVMTSNGETKTYTITYQGNTAKIDKITETGGRVETYLYNGNLISKKYNGTDEAASKDYDSYEYDGSSRLTKELAYRHDKSQPGVTKLSYLETKTIVTGDETGGKLELSYDSKGNLTNLAMFEEDIAVAQLLITYDDKSASFRNVPGWREIRYLIAVPLGDNIGFEDILATGNNPLKVTGNVDGKNTELIYSYEFKDSKKPKFPTKIIGTIKVGAETSTFTAEITYR